MIAGINGGALIYGKDVALNNSSLTSYNDVMFSNKGGSLEISGNFTAVNNSKENARNESILYTDGLVLSKTVINGSVRFEGNKIRAFRISYGTMNGPEIASYGSLTVRGDAFFINNTMSGAAANGAAFFWTILPTSISAETRFFMEIKRKEASAAPGGARGTRCERSDNFAGEIETDTRKESNSRCARGAGRRP